MTRTAIAIAAIIMITGCAAAKSGLDYLDRTNDAAEEQQRVERFERYADGYIMNWAQRWAPGTGAAGIFAALASAWAYIKGHRKGKNGGAK